MRSPSAASQCRSPIRTRCCFPRTESPRRTWPGTTPMSPARCCPGCATGRSPWCATPPDGKRFAEVRRAALWARDLLDGELGLTSFVRTTGGRGLHVHVGLNRRADFDEVREFAHRVAEMLARRHPDAITAEQRKDKRG